MSNSNTSKLLKYVIGNTIITLSLYTTLKYIMDASVWGSGVIVGYQYLSSSKHIFHLNSKYHMKSKILIPGSNFPLSCIFR